MILHKSQEQLKNLSDLRLQNFVNFFYILGSVILKNVLPDDCYQHFMVFSVSLRIFLRSKQSSKYLCYAQKLFEYFVK